MPDQPTADDIAQALTQLLPRHQPGDLIVTVKARPQARDLSEETRALSVPRLAEHLHACLYGLPGGLW